MPVQLVKTPHGDVPFPADATPEEIAAALNSVDMSTNHGQMTHKPSTALNVENPMKTLVKAIPRGAVKAGEFLTQMGMDMGEGATGGAYGQNVLPKVPPVGEKLIPTASNANPAYNIAGEALGGGAALGPSTPLRSAFAGLTATGGSELGGAGFGAPGAFAGGLFGGLAGGFGAGPRQSRASREIRKAAEGIPGPEFPDYLPGDYGTASRNLNKFASSKVTTATLPEAFPGNTRLLSLALEARNSRGGEALSTQVSGREADLGNLTKRVIERSGEPGVPANVTNEARATAEAVLKRAKTERTNAYQNDLQGASNLAPQTVDSLRQIFLANAKASESHVERDAYLAAAHALTDANPGVGTVTSTVKSPPVGQAGFRVANKNVTTEVPTSEPKTSISAIAKDLKQMQERVNDLNLTGGQKLDKNAVNKRYQDVQEVLKALSPQYRTAEANYANTSRNVVDPLVSGPIGDLSGRNPNSRVDPQAALLTNITKDQTPESIPGVMSTLESGAQLPSRLLPQIARTLVGQKLAKGPLDPGKTLRGTPGSPEEANLVALLKGANMPTEPVTSALEAGDLLQNFKNAPSTTGERPMQSVGIRMVTAADRALGTKMQERYYRQIADLLSKPTQQSLAELQKIAMFDPYVRRQLMTRSLFVPTATQGER